MSNRTEAAWRKPRHLPPEGYRHCASSRLYSQLHSFPFERRRRIQGEELELLKAKKSAFCP